MQVRAVPCLPFYILPVVCGLQLGHRPWQSYLAYVHEKLFHSYDLCRMTSLHGMPLQAVQHTFLVSMFCVGLCSPTT